MKHTHILAALAAGAAGLALAGCGPSGTEDAADAEPAAGTGTADAGASETPAPAETDGSGADAGSDDMADAASDEAADAGSDDMADAGDAAEPAAQTFEIAGYTGNAADGRRVFQQCMACHVLEDGVNRVGPSLYGVIGREAGSVEGFRYSQSNSSSDVVWTEEVLFEYLENPRQFLPGTIMAFAGLRDPQQRADVIAYIKANGGDAE